MVRAKEQEDEGWREGWIMELVVKIFHWPISARNVDARGARFNILFIFILFEIRFRDPRLLAALVCRTYYLEFNFKLFLVSKWHELLALTLQAN